MRPCKSSVGLMSDANRFNPCLAQSFGMVKMPLCRRYRDRDQPKVFFQSFSLSPSTVPPSHVLMAKTCMSSCQSICQAAHTRYRYKTRSVTTSHTMSWHSETAATWASHRPHAQCADLSLSVGVFPFLFSSFSVVPPKDQVKLGSDAVMPNEALHDDGRQNLALCLIPCDHLRLCRFICRLSKVQQYYDSSTRTGSMQLNK
ncbi:hypothetical protein LZ32DRAFT_386533 [Colletotrichum eremochloae]|nr:hypothetical protein LZ32DRAFT_386533 [Colletotrichum eremochloae]